MRRFLVTIFPRLSNAPPTTRRVGRCGERAAARHLRRDGYRVLARNVRVPMGEADLVCLAPDRRTVVIVEVKARLATPGGPPPEANIHAHKQQKLLSIARHLARANGWKDRPVRIDAVAVEFSGRTRLGGLRVAALRHHTGAVRA